MSPISSPSFGASVTVAEATDVAAPGADGVGTAVGVEITVSSAGGLVLCCSFLHATNPRLNKRHTNSLYVHLFLKSKRLNIAWLLGKTNVCKIYDLYGSTQITHKRKRPGN